MNRAYPDRPDLNIAANKELSIGDGCEIGPNVTVMSMFGSVSIGSYVDLSDCKIVADEDIVIGDCVKIAPGTDIHVGSLRIDDYTTLWQNILANGRGRLTIGYNSWIGRDSVLNATADLNIGDGFRAGINTHIWTHVSSGLLYDGCQLFGKAPTIISDDVWCVGSNVVICPATHVAHKTIVLPNSVLAQGTTPGHVYSGVPAVDVTEKVPGYKPITDTDEWELLVVWEQDFAKMYAGNLKLRLVHSLNGQEEVDKVLQYSGRPLVIVGQYGWIRDLGPDVTTMSCKTRKYTKRLTKPERDVMRFFNDHKIRFTPSVNEGRKRETN